MHISVKVNKNKLAEGKCFLSEGGHKFLKDAIEDAVKALYERLSARYFCPDLNTEADWFITRDDRYEGVFASMISFIRAGDRVEVRQNFKHDSKMDVGRDIWFIVDYIESDLDVTVQDIYMSITNGCVAKVDISVDAKEKDKGFYWGGSPSCLYVSPASPEGRRLDISNDMVFYSIHQYLLKPVLEAIATGVGLEWSETPLEIHYGMVEGSVRVYVPLTDSPRGYAVPSIMIEWLNTYCDMLFRHLVGKFSGNFFATTMEIDYFGDGTFGYWMRV